MTVSKVISLGAFCEAGYPVTRSSFESFSAQIFKDHNPGILTLDWIPRVTLSQRAAFEKAARDSGLAGYEIRDSLDPTNMVRSGDRPVYFPVLYLQHREGAGAGTGFDLYSNPVRRDAITRAIATGELAATQRFHLLKDTTGQRGVVILRPVYHRSGDQKELLGVASTVVRFSDMVEQHGANSGVDLAIIDLSAAPGEQELYPSAGKRPQPVSSFTQYRTIQVGGRTWRVVASPMPGAFPVNKKYSYMTSAFCFVITLLVAAYLLDVLDRRTKVERLVEERTGALNAAIHSLARVHRGLEESESRYRRLVEDSPIAIVVERAGKIVLVNRAAAEMFGVDVTREDQDHDHSLAEFVVPERRELAKKIIADLYTREMQIPPRETQVLHQDGTVLDAEVAMSSYLHDGILSIQALVRDISQRKRSFAENARLISAIEQVEESIVITDLDANIVYVNPAFVRVSGYSREEALGKTPRVLKSGRHTPEFYAALWKSLKAGESWSGHLINRAKDGRLFTEEATISPVLNSSGEVIHYVAVKRDVTAEIEIQEQLHQSQKMDAVGRLAGGVAHDFNNMLMVIVSYAEMIDSGLPESDPLRQYAAHILKAAHRSSALTRQLLAFSRKQELAPRVLDCNAIVTETTSMVRRLIGEDIDLQCELAPDLWRVKADADQLVQVMLNLCVNSRDAMPGGGKIVIATRNNFDPCFVELSVSDNGVGIPLEIHEKLFEPFFTTKERGRGTGLGLATVYGIVQQSGGFVRVESAPGQGATFRVYLPRCLEADAATEVPLETYPTVAGCRLLLVVEDEDALRVAITEQLREVGYRVLAAANGIEALDILVRNPGVCLMISDLLMPRMGGRELARHATSMIPELRVIFMSGYAEHAFSGDDKLEGRPVKCIHKPFSMKDLLACIAELGSHCPGAIANETTQATD